MLQTMKMPRFLRCEAEDAVKTAVRGVKYKYYKIHSCLFFCEEFKCYMYVCMCVCVCLNVKVSYAVVDLWHFVVRNIIL